MIDVPDMDILLDRVADFDEGLAKELEAALGEHYIPKPHDVNGLPVSIGDWIAAGADSAVRVYGIGMDELADGHVVRIREATGPWVTFFGKTERVPDPKESFLQEFADAYNSTRSPAEEQMVIEEYAKKGMGVF